MSLTLLEMLKRTMRGVKSLKLVAKMWLYSFVYMGSFSSFEAFFSFGFLNAGGWNLNVSKLISDSQSKIEKISFAKLSACLLPD